MKKIFSRLLCKISKKLRLDGRNSRLEQGQVLVIVTLSVIGLVAAVGLTVDVGLLYLNHGKLRRAVDAAALAATSQFREGYDTNELAAAAVEFLDLNGFKDATATVESCKTNPGDPVLCTEPAPRKLVRVHATSVVKLAFLPVIGIPEATISATAVSEAASMDVVFVIDTSESMAYKADPGAPMRDPSQCSPLHACEPFEDVKAAAEAFVGQLYMPYDRVAIVTFDDTSRVNFSFADFDNEPDATKKARVLSEIDALNLVTVDVCPTSTGPCRDYERYADDDPVHGNSNGYPYDEPVIDDNGDGIGDNYLGFRCPVGEVVVPPGVDPDTWSPNADTCGTTSIGRGLQIAGNEFAEKVSFRQEALWVVILLTDGAANGPSSSCPDGTLDDYPYCRDLHLTPRHCFNDESTYCLDAGGVVDPDEYDADDYARDMADFIANDQDALIFSIGLGNLVRTSEPRAKLDAEGEPTTTKCNPGDPIDDCMGAGEQLLRYAAVDVGGGKYYFAPSGSQLRDIFLDIASNLATRLTQ